MIQYSITKKICFIKYFALLSISLLCFSAKATIVQFETNFGNFEVNLYDNATPQTVENFLQYVADGDYSNAVFHRSVNNFIVQGGGFSYQTAWPLGAISTNPAVANEPVYSNVRGTIAMAKLSSDPNSATNQWFFNLADNSLNLDRQNQGFTVFGEVQGDGMAIIDSIAALPTYDLDGAFTEIPLQNFDISNTPDDTHLVMITNIQVIDATVDTAAGLSPPANIGPEPIPDFSGDDTPGGSGSLTYLVIITLFVQLRRKLKKHF